MAAPSVFERHPRVTLACFWLAFLLLFAAAAEVALRKLTGMGEPVLFHQDPAYGYRLLPNQETWRFGGAHFKINNLGLRASEDWDRSRRDKILFVGDSVTYGGNRIANEDLFSSVATRGFAHFHSGNAGTPNWGVENMYGLIVQEKFLPASVYVITAAEESFYLGLSVPTYKPWIKYQKPYLALQEMAEFYWYKYFTQVRERNQEQVDAVAEGIRAEHAAVKLKAIDEVLDANAYPHLIFITPTRKQVLGQEPVDRRVKALLEKHAIQAIYLLDKPRVRNASDEEKLAWFHDNNHLTKAGHEVWGELIGEELARVLPKEIHGDTVRS